MVHFMIDLILPFLSVEAIGQKQWSKVLCFYRHEVSRLLQNDARLERDRHSPKVESVSTFIPDLMYWNL